MKQLILSKAIKGLFPKSETEEAELKALEDSLKKYGCRDDLVVWKGKNILVDGYRRYEICKRLKIPFQVTYMSFSSIAEAKRWAIGNQLLRRNLSNWQRGRLAALIWRKDLVKLADANKKLSKGRGKKGRKISDNLFESIDVKQRLAEKAGLSKDTMGKVIKVIDFDDKDVFSRLDKGDISINQGYNDMKRKMKHKSKSEKALVEFDYINDLSKGIENNPIHMKALKGLKLVPNNSVSLIFTSPPFNVDMPYKNETQDTMPYEEYLAWLEDVFSACYPKLRKGGKIVVEIEEIKTREKKDQPKEYRRPTVGRLEVIMSKIGFCYQGTIIWDKGKVGNNAAPWTSCGYPSDPKIRPMHSNVLIWSKGPSELPCITKDLSPIEIEEYKKLTKSIWRIPTGAKNPTSHCCPFPVKLAEGVVRLLSHKDDLCMDIFGGSGTVAVACVRNQRRFIYIDASKTYCKEASDWIERERQVLNTNVTNKKAA